MYVEERLATPSWLERNNSTLYFCSVRPAYLRENQRNGAPASCRLAAGRRDAGAPFSFHASSFETTTNGNVRRAFAGARLAAAWCMAHPFSSRAARIVATITSTVAAACGHVSDPNTGAVV